MSDNFPLCQSLCIHPVERRFKRTSGLTARFCTALEIAWLSGRRSVSPLHPDISARSGSLFLNLRTPVDFMTDSPEETTLFPK